MVTTALRERMRAILRARNYSPRTEKTYIAAVTHFARHFKTPPDRLGAEHVIAYQVWLREQKHASYVLFNQTVCALRFFYTEVLERPDVVQRIRYARHERRLPVVLSVSETIDFLSSIDLPRYARDEHARGAGASRPRQRAHDRDVYARLSLDLGQRGRSLGTGPVHRPKDLRRMRRDRRA